MKLFIVLLVVLVILMVVGMGLGARKDNSTTSDASEGWPAKIEGLLVRKQPLSRQDIQASVPSQCLSQFQQGLLILPPGASCQFIIQESRTHVRQVIFRLQQGNLVNLHLELAGENELTSDIELKPGADDNEKDVQFFRDGGALTVTCVSATQGGQCRIGAN